MDALRKAEEAKRQAAQKQREDIQQESQPSRSEPSAVEDLENLEESLAFDRELTSSMAMPDEPEQPASVLAEVEVPFDFEIDENFGLDSQTSSVDELEVKPSEAEASTDKQSLDEEPSIVAAAETQAVFQSEEDPERIDYLLPDDLSRFTTPTTSPSSDLHELEFPETVDAEVDEGESLENESGSTPPIAPEPVSLGLTLEDRAPDIERPSIINDDLESPQQRIVEEEVDPVPPAVEESAPEPIRALRNNDATSKESEQSHAPEVEAKVVKAPTPKFTQESRKRESARAVFSAKHKANDNGSRKKLIAATAVIALFPLVGGGYLLLESMGILSSGNQYNIPTDYNANNDSYVYPLEDEIVEESVLADLSPEPIVMDVPVQDLAAEQIVVADVQSEIAPELDAGTDASAVPAEQEAVAAEVTAPQSPIAAQQSAEPDVQVADPIPAETVTSVAAVANAPAPTPINITRTDNVERVDPQLTQAYAAYRSNDFIGARARYQQVLRDKPNNRDAMLGMAAVSMRLGDASSARDTYIKLLELDPRDVHARVGLLETMPASDPVMLESELRTLFEAHPEVAQLAFALGNLFASQRRWSDAQQSYYDALLAAKAGGSELISPDYAFNLAVSLERLNQLSPAYTFYRQALEQSESVAPGFDIRVLRERLDALERVLP